MRIWIADAALVAGICVAIVSYGCVPPSLGVVPAVAPDFTPDDLYADSNVVVGSSLIEAPFVKNVVDVLFCQGTTQADRQSAIDRIRGRVIGGSRLDDSDGIYLVRFPGDGADTTLLRVVKDLARLPQVEMATPETLLDLTTGHLTAGRPTRSRANPNQSSPGYGAVNAREATTRVPAVAPDSLPLGYFDDSNLVQKPDSIEGLFVRDVVGVLFKPGVSQGRRQSAIDAIHGSVVGGVRFGPIDGVYLVRLPHDRTNNNVFNALAVLARNPYVSLATPDMVDVNALAYGRSKSGGRQHTSSPPRPLVEFMATDDTSARDAVPRIENCGYYLQIHGASGHDAGFNLGAAVQLQRDTMVIRIESYRASNFIVHDWRWARWTLQIGGLQSKRYWVDVVAGQDRVTRDVTLGAAGNNCSA